MQPGFASFRWLAKVRASSIEFGSRATRDSRADTRIDAHTGQRQLADVCRGTAGWPGVEIDACGVDLQAAPLAERFANLAVDRRRRILLCRGSRGALEGER